MNFMNHLFLKNLYLMEHIVYQDLAFQFMDQIRFNVSFQNWNYLVNYSILTGFSMLSKNFDFLDNSTILFYFLLIIFLYFILKNAFLIFTYVLSIFFHFFIKVNQLPKHVKKCSKTTVTQILNYESLIFSTFCF